MSTHLSLITDRIAKISIIFGIAFLVVGLALSLMLIPGKAAGVNGQGDCSTGYVYKDNNSPFGYDGDEVITKVFVKSGQGCFPLTITNPSDGCYQATGLGTTSVSVTKIGEGRGQVCQDISHVEFLSDPTDPPVTETPVTETPVTETPVTETPVTETPVTETPVTETPVTETPVTETPVTETPVTETPVTETPVTETPVTETPITETPVTETPVTTEVPATTEAPTATDPPTTKTPTEEIRTPTPPPTLAKPTSIGTSQVLIPQTGLDLSNQGGIGFWLILFMGIGLVGTGLVFQGVSSQVKRKK